MPETTAKRTSAATCARILSLQRMSASERKAIGLRLFAIYSGRQSQKAYRMRGIDAAAQARAGKAKKRAARLAAENQTRSKLLSID
jgi:hypothetical protein